MTSRTRRHAAGTLTLVGLALATAASLHWTASAQDGKRGAARPHAGLPAGEGSLIHLEIKDEATAPTSDEPARPPLAPTTPLSGEDTQKVLARLAAIAPEPGSEFALRDESLPPPRTGATVESPFPPPASDDTGPGKPEKIAAGPLEVLRHQPDGEVPIAPHFSITFNQPMVAVTSHATTVETIPVKLTPAVPGAWRWVGTKTLLFEPKPRFPMATVYTAEVPAGTTSAVGGKLETAASFTFSTPPVKLESSWPQGSSVGLSPIFFASFDQAIDPAAVLAKAHLEGGRGDWSLRLATADEIAADAPVHASSKSSGEGRWLAFRPTTALPTATAFRVLFSAGTPSAEGPRPTTTEQGYSFQTYGPLRVTRKWPDNEAPPWSGFSVELSNPLDVAKFAKELVTIEPELKGAKIACSGNYISISGATQGRTTYKVTLHSALTDVFGQTLGSDTPLEFKIGSAPESFWGTSGLVVLDPAGPRSFSIYSVNVNKLKVRAYSVTPDLWTGFHALNEKWVRDRTLGTPPGKCVLEDTVHPKGEADALTETPIDLSSAFDAGLGHAIVIVEPMVQPAESWRRQAIIAWVESTKIAVDAFVDRDRLLAWATTLKEGKPLEGAAITVEPWGIGGATAKDGTAWIDLAPDARAGACAVARVGKDSALLPEHVWWWSNSTAWLRQRPQDSLRWWVADDRHLYRPGEEVHVKGWIRRFGDGPRADLAPLAGAAKTIHYALRDSRGNEVLKGDCPVDALGGWDAAFTLPPTMNLGNAWLQLSAMGGTLGGATTHSIDVQEFRRPEFEVQTSTSPGPYLVGDHATVTVAANYYSGGGLPNAQVNWNVTASEGGFTPPGCADYSFGVWVPWWESWSRSGSSARFDHEAKTDASGRHALGLDLLGLEHARPVVLTASATVMDVNRQAWSSHSSLLVHPASEYVGLKSPRTFVRKGRAARHGRDRRGPRGQASRRPQDRDPGGAPDWDFENGRYVRKKSIRGEDARVRQGRPCGHLQPTEGGTYTCARGSRTQRPRQRSELTLWVAGGKTQPSRDVEQERVTLVPDKRDYKPGETAEILVTPFSNAEAIVSLGGWASSRPSASPSTGLLTYGQGPIEEAYTPNLHVRVDLVGQAPRLTDAGVADPKLPPRPAFAVGELDLQDPAARPQARARRQAARGHSDSGQRNGRRRRAHRRPGQARRGRPGRRRRGRRVRAGFVGLSAPRLARGLLPRASGGRHEPLPTAVRPPRQPRGRAQGSARAREQRGHRPRPELLRRWRRRRARGRTHGRRRGRGEVRQGHERRRRFQGWRRRLALDRRARRLQRPRALRGGAPDRRRGPRRDQAQAAGLAHALSPHGGGRRGRQAIRPGRESKSSRACRSWCARHRLGSSILVTVSSCPSSCKIKPTPCSSSTSPCARPIALSPAPRVFASRCPPTTGSRCASPPPPSARAGLGSSSAPRPGPTWTRPS